MSLYTCKLPLLHIPLLTPVEHGGKSNMGIATLCRGKVCVGRGKPTSCIPGPMNYAGKESIVTWTSKSAHSRELSGLHLQDSPGRWQAMDVDIAPMRLKARSS